MLSSTKTLFACRYQKGFVDYQKAHLSGEWDPLGVVFMVKPFELAFDKGDFCFIWSGLDDQKLDKYTVSFTTISVDVDVCMCIYHHSLHLFLLQIKLMNPKLEGQILCETDGQDITFGSVSRHISFILAFC